MSYAIDIAMVLLIFFFILTAVINISNYRIANPVEGRDSTSGYASIFYIGKEKYENAEVGEKIRITQC